MFEKYMARIKVEKYRWLIVLGFAIITLLIAWCSDDAYHAYAMARNLADGNGFVYNVGYRVNVTTCPLFTLITALFYAIFGHMYYLGICLGVAFSALAVWVVVFKVCKSTKTALFTVAILLGSYCFMCYTTAGLENSLLYLLAVLFIYLYDRTVEFSAKDLFLLALVLSLLAFTRMDSVLLFVPAIVVAYLFFTKVKFWKRVLLGLAGLMPFICWEIFSLFYYGYFFPNTMYVKLNTGFAQSDYYARGLDFMLRSSFYDILLLLLPICFVVLTILLKNKKMMLVASGVVLYLFYIIYVGGDFMVGRHLTVPFFVSLVGVVLVLQGRNVAANKAVPLHHLLITLLIIGIAWSSCVRPIAKTYLMGGLTFTDSPSVTTGVADEKEYYYPYTGLFAYITTSNVWDTFRWSEAFAHMREQGMEGYCLDALPGVTFYAEQENSSMYLTDRFALMDPLLSHLPAEWTENWRIGHMQRAMPDGYQASVMAGENLITDPSLHEYYDKVLLIVTGDLWDIERLETIVKMNLGEYDYLIEEYLLNLDA